MNTNRVTVRVRVRFLMKIIFDCLDGCCGQSVGTPSISLRGEANGMRAGSKPIHLYGLVLP